MRFLLDDVARIMASPIPRRQAFKLLGGALSGAILGTLGIRPAAAMSKCSPGTAACHDLFDMFDSFFVPYAAFDGVVRPGPRVEIFKNLCKR